MKKKKVMVIGLGTFGTEVSKQLTIKGVEVLAVDSDHAKIDAINEDVAYAVALDATNKKALLSQDIEDYDAVVIAIGDNFEERIKCLAVLNDIKVKEIYCRTMNNSETFIIKKLGVSHILSPETEIADIVAEKITYPNIISFSNTDSEHLIAEVDVLHDMVDRQVGDVDFIQKYKLELITIRRSIFNSETNQGYHDVGIPKSDMAFNEGDRIVVYGRKADIERFISINN